jgi:N-methylhydantoinase B
VSAPQARPALDPASIEVLWTRLISIAEEQARALYRGSFSVSTSEVEDYCSTLHDADGRMIAQSVSSGTISMLTGQTMSIRRLVAQFRDTVQPGDAIIWNDPWLLAGHKFDVVMASPVFRGQRLVAWSVTSLHAADIGGRGFSAAAADTFEEGLTFPPLRLYKAGRLDAELADFIRANVRMPDQVVGDFMAQAAANEVGGSKVLALLEDGGLADLQPLADEIVGRSEAAMRAAISAVPDGVYTHAVDLDGFDQPLRVACALTVRGDELSADFAGTSPQVEGAINAVGYVAYGRVAHCVKSSLLPRVPNNEGLFRPISVVAPEGSLVNARHPAPTAARHVLHFFIASACFGALARISPTPAGVIADSGAGMIQSVRERRPNGSTQEYWIRFNHGMGATPHRDGYSGMSAPNNVGTTPLEIIEARTRALILEKELVPDSEGAGAHRGGFAQRYRFTVRNPEPTLVSCMFDRTKHPPLGYLGGRPGAPAEVRINEADVQPKGQHRLLPGDVFTLVGPGGGGFFDPRTREPERVVADVRDELISIDRARDVYGVAIRAETLTLDDAETGRLRAARAADETRGAGNDVAPGAAGGDGDDPRAKPTAS